jgi:uncharacterized protein with HEPN domain
MKKTVKHYLDDLKEYIGRVKEVVNGLSEKEFSRDTILQDALLKRIEVIGEIVKRIPESYKAKYPKVPWKKIAGSRDKIVHDYEGIDFSMVWLIATENILELEKMVDKMIEEKEFHEFED